MPTPPALQSIVDLFAEAPRDVRLEAILEYSQSLPPLPERLQGHRDQMEQVIERQTPFFLASEIDDSHHAHFWFDAPPQAPTTRGFAGILASGLNGATPEDVLATTDDFYDAMGLSEVISALRMRGMAAILFRLKRQVRTALEAETA